MTAAETRQFIGDTFPVKYYTQNGYVETVAHYDSAYTAGGYTETSENPLGFMVGGSVTWLFYSISASGVNTVPSEITCSLQPTYSIFDTEYLYTCFALSSGANANGVPSTSVYSSPTSNWYIGGTVNNFRNSSESAAGSGIHAFLNLGFAFRFTYVPIVASSQSAFSAYCMDCNFYGNTTSYNTYYFAVMCPYVSGDASGASGAFTTGSLGSDVNVNVTVNVDMSATNDLLGDILDGVAPIATLVDILTDDSDIPEAGTVVSMPFGDDDYDEMLMTADAILDDIPDTVAAAGFWVEVTNSFFPSNSWLRLIMPILMIMALMAWLLWKK